MTDEMRPSADPQPQSLRVRPVNRLRLATRVAAQLADLGEDVIVEVDSEGSAREARTDGLASDFLISSLDLRIRLSLLVTGEVDDADDPGSHVSAALALLDLYPDTDAIVVVADDEDLNCVVVEPYDRQEALLLPRGERAESNRAPARGPAPLRSSVAQYLRSLSPAWDAVAALPLIESSNSREIAEGAALRALADLRQMNYRVPEKLVARDALSQADADFAVGLTMRLLSGQVDVVSEIQRWVDDR